MRPRLRIGIAAAVRALEGSGGRPAARLTVAPPTPAAAPSLRNSRRSLRWLMVASRSRILRLCGQGREPPPDPANSSASASVKGAMPRAYVTLVATATATRVPGTSRSEAVPPTGELSRPTAAAPPIV